MTIIFTLELHATQTFATDNCTGANLNATPRQSGGNMKMCVSIRKPNTFIMVTKKVIIKTI